MPKQNETLTISSWPYQRTDCGYILDLYSNLQDVTDRPLEVSEFRLGRIWRAGVDVLHIHWPEIALDSPSNLKAALKAGLVLADLSLMKLRGAKIIFTRHDLVSHKQSHPRAERRFVRAIEHLSNGFIHLTEMSVKHFAAAGVPDRPLAVIPQGINPSKYSVVDREDAKRELGIPDRLTVGLVGRLEQYKNVLELIDAFPQENSAELLIAGQPVEDSYRQEILKRRNQPGVSMKLGRLEREEFERCLVACDLVVLPYSNHLNSGVAMEALAAGAKLAVSASPATRELAGLAGPDWIRIMSVPPTEGDLIELIKWAAEAPETDLRLPFEWPEVALETLGFIKSVADSD